MTGDPGYLPLDCTTFRRHQPRSLHFPLLEDPPPRGTFFFFLTPDLSKIILALSSPFPGLPSCGAGLGKEKAAQKAVRLLRVVDGQAKAPAASALRSTVWGGAGQHWSGGRTELLYRLRRFLKDFPRITLSFLGRVWQPYRVLKFRRVSGLKLGTASGKGDRVEQALGRE